MGDDQAQQGLETALAPWLDQVLQAASAACSDAPTLRDAGPGADGGDAYEVMLEEGSPCAVMTTQDESVEVCRLARSSDVVLFSNGNPCAPSPPPPLHL